MERDTTKTRRIATVTRPKRRRRWIILLLVGILIAAPVIFFLARVYNPFGTRLEDPLVLIPSDVDFVLSVADFPTFVGELRKRELIENLELSKGFRDFLATPWARNTGVVEALRDAFRGLDDFGGSLPLNLSLLGDVSGTHVVVAGYVPEKEGDPWRFMVVFQPGSWMTVAAVNVLLDETLCSWFVEDRLGGQLQIERQRDSVGLRPRGSDRSFYVTRIADAVLVSTEGRQLSRIHTAVQVEGIPTEFHSRFLPLTEIDTDTSKARLLARQSAADRALQLRETLLEQWGPEDLDLAESSLPRIAGEDVLVQISIEKGLTASVSGPEGAARDGSFALLLQGFGKNDLRAAVETIGGMMPRDRCFGLVYLQAAPGRVIETFTLRPDMFSTRDHETFDEALAEIPSLGSRLGLFDTFDQVARREIAIVFFEQPRAELRGKAQVGYALVLNLADEERVRSILREMQAEIRRRRGQGTALKDIVASERDGIHYYALQPAAGAVDDPRVTEPGIAIARGHLILTNWYPFLRELPKVASGEIPAMSEDPGIVEALAYAPARMRLGALVSYRAMTDYLEQSVRGWATSQTTPSGADQTRKRAEIISQVQARGIPVGTRAHNDEVERLYTDWEEVEERVKRPQIEREIRQHIGFFQDLLSSLGIYVEENLYGVSLSLRLDVQSQDGGS